jgi:hypothetical protein
MILLPAQYPDRCPLCPLRIATRHVDARSQNAPAESEDKCRKEDKKQYGVWHEDSAIRHRAVF